MGNSLKILCLFIGLSLIGCTKDVYKTRLTPVGKRQTMANPYGAYINVNTSTGQSSGEFISYVNDTLYVMTMARLTPIEQSEIVEMKLHLTANKSRRYKQILGFGLIPSAIGALAYPSYSGGFILLAVWSATMGGAAILVENRRKPQIITYPSDSLSLSELARFSRFPAGFPADLDLSELKRIERQIMP